MNGKQTRSTWRLRPSLCPSALTHPTSGISGTRSSATLTVRSAWSGSTMKRRICSNTIRITTSARSSPCRLTTVRRVGLWCSSHLTLKPQKYSTTLLAASESTLASATTSTR
uniref:Uncharacterized protein n=1 Tax=uncultured marine virus TaxID=186617 RepID=A0A0F7L7D5_9VIRU|nr:hypothetical protein [uncultured marine virus]